MIIEFKIKNFRSFQEETVLSMVASSDKTLSENTFPTPEFGNRHLLNSAVIYGPNAAGKSNLIAAAKFLVQFTRTSMDRKISEPIDVSPFLFTTESDTKPSEFEVTFIDDENIRFQYGIHLTTDRVVREWLIAYPKGLPQTWFVRELLGDKDSEPSWYFGRHLKGKNSQLAEFTRSDVSFLSNAAKFNHRQLGQVLQWVKNSLRVIDTNEPVFSLSFYSAVKAKENVHNHEAIRNLLQVADFGISDFDIQERTFTDKDFPETTPVEVRNQLVNKKTLDVFMYHSIVGEQDISLPLDEESSGTQRYFSLSGPLAEILENGWTLFVDELDSSLHPLLVRYIIQLFHSPQFNPKGAQLIFNTHDTTLMDCCLFRRDQIWFVEKDRKGCSHLYPLLDFSPRQHEALEKGYLMGRYGAIPFLGELQWGEA